MAVSPAERGNGTAVTGDVSVVITTYNHAHFLSAAIESVLDQSVLPAEILVVDDGSTDAPDKVTGRFAGVRLYRQDNRGLAAARNAGLRETSGEFLVFLDADDLLLPQSLASGVALLAQHPDAAFSYGGYRRLYADGRTYPAEYHQAQTDCFAQFLSHNPVGMHGTVMYRRHAIEAAKGFREDLAASEDYDLFLRLCRDHRAVSQSGFLADYRQHDCNMSRNSAMMLRWTLEVLHARAEDAKRLGLDDVLAKGSRSWREYYAGVWANQLLRGPRHMQLITQGIDLMRQAPRETAAALVRGTRSRLQEFRR